MPLVRFAILERLYKRLFESEWLDGKKKRAMPAFFVLEKGPSTCYMWSTTSIRRAFREILKSTDGTALDTWFNTSRNVPV